MFCEGARFSSLRNIDLVEYLSVKIERATVRDLVRML